MLMPADEIEPWLPRRSNQLELLEEGSETWGVSMQALLYRARVLGTLSDSSYTRAMRQMSASAGAPTNPSRMAPRRRRWSSARPSSPYWRAAAASPA
jgi:Zn-dependent peptidase ImmA (M78 family)